MTILEDQINLTINTLRERGFAKEANSVKWLLDEYSKISKQDKIIIGTFIELKKLSKSSEFKRWILDKISDLINKAESDIKKLI